MPGDATDHERPRALVVEDALESRILVSALLFLAGTALVAERLRELRALGVRLALDDFGTGLSSLGYLERLPLDVLKIDRSFVASLTDGESRGPVVAAIARLAEALELRTVAEGIETAEQLDALRAIGCDRGQGYLFSRPVPEHLLGDLLRRGPLELEPV